MFPKIIFLILFINSFSTFSQATETAETNEAKLLQSINAQLSELRAEVERLKKDGADKEIGIRILSDLEQTKKLIDGLFKPHHCSEAKTSGINEILLSNFISQPFKVDCDAKTRGGGWTVILRRMDGSVDFNRSWTEYKNGFGHLNGEFFLGLDKIHALTADRKQELLVVVEDFEGVEAFETYDEFAIGNENQQYLLRTLGYASGTAGDSLSYHRHMKFSTFDRDNDNKQSKCSDSSKGAWWYNACHDSNLAGTYNNNHFAQGVNWKTFRGFEYSLKTAVMMIRPLKDPLSL